jgi:CheY-specific phosphatase CheX
MMDRMDGRRECGAFEHWECAAEATAGSFAMICGDEPEWHVEGAAAQSYDGIVAVISIVGDVAWVVMLCLPRDTANAIARRFAGYDIAFDSPDMGDAVGEMVNVIAGDLLARLEAVGVKAEMSLPTVARGTDIEPVQHGRMQTMRIGFASAEGAFDVKLAVTDQLPGREP